MLELPRVSFIFLTSLSYLTRNKAQLTHVPTSAYISPPISAVIRMEGYVKLAVMGTTVAVGTLRVNRASVDKT